MMQTRLFKTLFKVIILAQLSTHAQTYTSKLVAGTPPKIQEINPLKLSSIKGIISNAADEIFVCDHDNHMIRKINLGNKITIVAGNGTKGYVDGPDTSSRFSNPRGITMDSKGNLYVIEDNKATVRKITPKGYVSTFVGSSDAYGDVDDKGTKAKLSTQIMAITIDNQDRIYITDARNNKIKSIDTAGNVQTVASGLYSLNAITIDKNNGTIYYSSEQNIMEGTLQNGKITSRLFVSNVFVQSLTYSYSLIFIGGGVSIGSGVFEIIQQVDGPKPIQLSSQNFLSCAPDKGGNTLLGDFTYIYTINRFSGTVKRDIYPQTVIKNYDLFKDVQGMITDGNGTVYIADAGSHRILMIDTLGVLSTFAGKDSSGLRDGNRSVARFNTPGRMTWDRKGNLLVVDNGNRAIRKITPNGQVSTIIKNEIYLLNAKGIAVDSKNNLYVSIYVNPNQILKIDTNGVIVPYITDATIKSVLPNAKLGMPFALQIDNDDHLYHTAQLDGIIYKTSTDLKKIEMYGELSKPSNDGNINNAAFQGAEDLALDSSGNLYVLDANIVRKISWEDSLVTTIAGNVASNTRGYNEGEGGQIKMDFPWCMAMAPNGKIYISDNGNNLIRVLEPSDLITHIKHTETVLDDLEVFPNPTEDRIFLRNIKNPHSYKIFDMLGNLLTQSTFKNDFVDLTSLNEGLYTLMISTDSGPIVRKVIKNSK